MQVCCPVCATDFPIEAGMIEGDAKRLGALLAGLEPTLGRALVGYLRLFKPTKQGLRLARAVKLANEVALLVATGEVCRDERAGVRRPASPAMWAAGMEQMLTQRERLSLPLDNHNYLRSVVFALADRADAAQERSLEEARRGGQRRQRPAENQATPLEKALEWVEHQLRLGMISPEQAEADRQDARAKHGGAHEQQ